MINLKKLQKNALTNNLLQQNKNMKWKVEWIWRRHKCNKDNMQHQCKKMQLERARFIWQKIQLDVKLKELEIRHQVLQEKRELERELKKWFLKNKNQRSQQASFRVKSPLHYCKKVIQTMLTTLRTQRGKNPSLMAAQHWTIKNVIYDWQAHLLVLKIHMLIPMLAPNTLIRNPAASNSKNVNGTSLMENRWSGLNGLACLLQIATVVKRTIHHSLKMG